MANIFTCVMAGLAFVPYAFYVLFAPRLGRSILTLISALALTLLPTVAIDTVLYGKLTVRLRGPCVASLQPIACFGNQHSLCLICIRALCRPEPRVLYCEGVSAELLAIQCGWRR